MKNYKKPCGCIYGEGEASPWYACKRHALTHGKSGDTENQRPWWLYILRLEDNNYYVGITHLKQPYRRIYQHGGILGAQWTKLHKPLEVLELRKLNVNTKSEAEHEEQRQTLALMDLYGHTSVRGGLLTYRGSYVKFMNHFFRDNQWEDFIRTAISVGFLLAVILYLLLKS